VCACRVCQVCDFVINFAESVVFDASEDAPIVDHSIPLFSVDHCLLGVLLQIDHIDQRFRVSKHTKLFLLSLLALRSVGQFVEVPNEKA